MKFQERGTKYEKFNDFSLWSSYFALRAFFVSPVAHAPGSPRNAFTLVELLVVIALVGIIATLTAAGIFQVISAQKQSNSERTVKTLASVLQKQWSYVIAQADQERIPKNVVDLAGGDARRARVIWKKLRLKQEFPMTFAEAHEPHKSYSGSAVLLPTDLPGLRSYQALPSAALSDPFLESSTCLLFALGQARGGAGISADALGSTASDLNGDSFKELVDSWGNPIAFFRFPTANAELDAANPARSGAALKYRDPLDPQGLLQTPSWNPSAGSAAFVNLCHALNAGDTARYIVPVLVSSGADGKWGLARNHTSNADLSVSVQKDANDNIMSFQVESRGE